MFGENYIIGHADVKLDYKGRFVVPAFTKAESDDELIVKKQQVEDNFVLKIYAINEYLNILERFKALRDNATSLEEYEKYQTKIENICQNLEFTIKIDKQKRLRISIFSLKEMNWQENQILRCDGLGTFLLVRKK